MQDLNLLNLDERTLKALNYVAYYKRIKEAWRVKKALKSLIENKCCLIGREYKRVYEEVCSNFERIDGEDGGVG